jgi:hypothetical protein
MCNRLQSNFDHRILFFSQAKKMFLINFTVLILILVLNLLFGSISALDYGTNQKAEVDLPDSNENNVDFALLPSENDALLEYIDQRELVSKSYSNIDLSTASGGVLINGFDC